MLRRPPRSTRTDTLFPYTTLFRSWVYIDVRGRDVGSVVADLQDAVAREIKPPAGVSIAFAGQFEYMQRAAERLKIVVPLTLAIIFADRKSTRLNSSH